MSDKLPLSVRWAQPLPLPPPPPPMASWPYSVRGGGGGKSGPYHYGCRLSRNWSEEQQTTKISRCGCSSRMGASFSLAIPYNTIPSYTIPDL